jgi:hypothetical protein
MQAHIRDYVENFVREQETLSDPQSRQSFALEQKSLAENLTRFLLRLDADEFNELIVAQLENYFRNPMERPAIRILLEAVGVGLNPELIERRSRSLPGDVVEGALLGAGLVALARMSIGVGRVGVFRAFAGTVREQARRVFSRSSGGLVPAAAEQAARTGIGARIAGLRPRTQMAAGVAGGAALGSVEYWASLNSSVREDPRPAVRALDLWIAFEGYALEACAFRAEAEAIAARADSSAAALLAVRLNRIQREFQSFRALAPELEDVSPIPTTPPRGASENSLLNNVRISGCRAGAVAVALPPIADDLNRAASALAPLREQQPDAPRLN